MSVQTDPYTFVNGTVADALQVNARFDNLYSLQNGGIDSDNMDLTASFAWTGTHSFTKSSSGVAYSLSLSNTSDTASSDAKQVISVGGSSAGDAFTNWNVSGVTNWVAGIDNSNSDLFVIQKAAAITSDYLVFADQPGTGATNYLYVQNSFNTASSSAQIGVQVGGSSAGDPVFVYGITGVATWVTGIDNSDNDYWKLQKSSALSSDYLLLAHQGGSGAGNLLLIQNSNNTASSDAYLQISCGGISGGDAYTVYAIAGGSYWHSGIDNSDSDKFKIGTGSAVGTNTYFQIDTSGNTTLFGDQTANTDGVYDSGVWDFCTANTFSLYGNTSPSRPSVKVDPTTGGGVMFTVCHPTLFTTRNVSFTYSGAVYTAGAPAATGYVNMSVNGTNYKLLCAT